MSDVERATLASCELFAGLTTEALATFEREVESVALAGRSVLFRRGDVGDALYVVARGRLRVIVESDEGGAVARRRTHEVGLGGFVGETALLLGTTRTATVIAVRDTRLLRLTREAFDRLVRREPTAAVELARTLARRLADAYEAEAGARFGTVAVVPAHEGVDVGALATSLVAAFGTIATTHHARMPADGSTPDPERLARVETDHRFVVYEAGGGLESAWSQACVRHADTVLVVADGSSPPTADDRSTLVQAFAGLADVELVLHGDRAAPALPWLGDAQIRAHHHVAPGSTSDAQRLARLLAGHAVGLALGGGGSRAAAHAGVLRAIERAGLPIDVVAGTSGGAMIGAMIALGWDSTQVVEGVRIIGSTPHGRDLGPPILSLMSGKALIRTLERLYGDARVEDLRRPFLAACTDLVSGELVVPRTGPLARVVRASASVPGVWPPVAIDGTWLVDGGLLDNVPVALLEARCSSGRRIAADVGRAPLGAAALSAPDAPSGWSLLGRAMGFGAPDTKLPSIVDVLAQATCISSLDAAANARRRATDFVFVDLDAEPSAADSVEASIERAYARASDVLARRA